MILINDEKPRRIRFLEAESNPRPPYFVSLERFQSVRTSLVISRKDFMTQNDALTQSTSPLREQFLRTIKK